MELLVKRTFKGPKYTIGKLFVDGEYFCDTLEDVVRNIESDSAGKVYGQTAIPPGTYKLVLSVSVRFKRLLPLLLKVPHFEGVRIHAGNTPRDTEGCILVGENKEKGKVLNSRYWERHLVARLTEASDITLTIE